MVIISQNCLISVLVPRENVKQGYLHIGIFSGDIVPLDMKGCICHFAKWQIHPIISKGAICNCHLSDESLWYIVVSGTRLHILYLYLYITWPVIIHDIIHSLMYAKYSTLWIFCGLAGWKLRLPLQTRYVKTMPI